MPETYNKTNLSSIGNSDKVNLERALKVNDRLGGHIVTGHIDGVGVLISRIPQKNAEILTIEAPHSIMKYIVTKGSIAVNGTSLTVMELYEKSFSVSLIPLTKEYTVLKIVNIGDKMNIECDILGKYVERLLMFNSSIDIKHNISENFLKEHGFIENM